jgi:phosphatidylinositol glycan class A protein
MGALGYTLGLNLYYVLLLLVSFCATFIGVVANLCGKRFNTNYYVARTFWHVTGPILGWKFEVTGEEHFKAVENGEQPAVILGNHQRCASGIVVSGSIPKLTCSVVDILYLGRMFPKRAAIMAKKELKWIPGLGWFSG